MWRSFYLVASVAAFDDDISLASSLFSATESWANNGRPSIVQTSTEDETSAEVVATFRPLQHLFLYSGRGDPSSVTSYDGFYADVLKALVKDLNLTFHLVEPEENMSLIDTIKEEDGADVALSDVAFTDGEQVIVYRCHSAGFPQTMTSFSPMPSTCFACVWLDEDGGRVDLRASLASQGHSPVRSGSVRRPPPWPA